MVALAVLMPIVASMGGNAGTQTMTVTVRALLEHANSLVMSPCQVSAESAVGLLNGLAFSTADAVERLEGAREPRALTLARAGLPLDAYFSASKLAWIIENVPAARTRWMPGTCVLRRLRMLFFSIA